MHNILRQLLLVLEEDGVEVKSINIEEDKIVLDYKVILTRLDLTFDTSANFKVRYGSNIYFEASLTSALDCVSALLMKASNYKAGDTVEAYGEHYMLIPIGKGTVDNNEFQLFNLSTKQLDVAMTKEELVTNGYEIVKKGEELC